MGECYVILGTTRSGTSVTTGLLHRLGVIMGWELIPEKGQTERYDWPDPTPMNPLGFFQDAPLENVQDSIWGDEYPPDGTRPPQDKRTELFKELIKMRCNRKHPKWGFKASRTPWMIPELLEACSDEVNFVCTERKKNLSAKSLNTWFPEYGMSQCNQWLDYATRQIERVLKDKQYKHIPRIVINFDKLHDETETVVKELANFVDLPMNDFALNFVDKSLRRVVDG